jgi:hypothetical protein
MHRKNRAVRNLNISKTNMGAMGQKGIVNIIRALHERDKLINLLSLDLSEVLLLGESRMRWVGLRARLLWEAGSTTQERWDPCRDSRDCPYML